MDFTEQQKADYVAGKAVKLENVTDKQGFHATMYIKFNPEKGRPYRYETNPDIGFDHPPAGDHFCVAKVLLQKRKAPMWVSFFFGAGDEARLATGIPRMAEPFAGALPDLLIQRASRRSRQRVQACPRHIPKRIPHPIGWGILFVIAHRFCCLLITSSKKQGAFNYFAHHF